jgi:2,3-diaminopropionate biosynthesis protein SbnA
MFNFSGLVDAPVPTLAGLMQQVGNTPLYPIHFRIHGRLRTVHLKLESENPTSSMKDRTAYGLIQDCEEAGLLHAGSTVVESTSGNLGVALAFVCKARGYAFIAVVDPKTTQENIARMKALGARIELVKRPDRYNGYLLSRLARVQALCAQNEDYIWTNQYANKANPRIHYRLTGPEIYRQMRKKVDVVFVPVSTGGTLTGIGRYLREVSPSTKIIGVDAYGSVVFGTPAAARRLTGIGASKPSCFISKDIYDDYMLVQDEEAFAFCHALFLKTGQKLGGSSGCVLFACAQFLAEHASETDIVCVCADSGENYNGTIYNEAWIQQLSQDAFNQQLQRGMEIILS